VRLAAASPNRPRGAAAPAAVEIPVRRPPTATPTPRPARYDWPLLRPLLDHLLEAQLRKFDASSSVEVRGGGPRAAGAPGAARLPRHAARCAVPGATEPA
jgi:hypothetical protein